MSNLDPQWSAPATVIAHDATGGGHVGLNVMATMALTYAVLALKPEDDVDSSRARALLDVLHHWVPRDEA